jgi:hypothetical protein
MMGKERYNMLSKCVDDIQDVLDNSDLTIHEEAAVLAGLFAHISIQAPGKDMFITFLLSFAKTYERNMSLDDHLGVKRYSPDHKNEE